MSDMITVYGKPGTLEEDRFAEAMKDAATQMLYKEWVAGGMVTKDDKYQKKEEENKEETFEEHLANMDISRELEMLGITEEMKDDWMKGL